MKYANLHMHSVYSDGIYTPEELCALAKGKGYKAVALSDHETVRGVDRMRAAAAAQGLGFIQAMETYGHGFGQREGAFHVVAMDFDPLHPQMKAYIDRCEELALDLTVRRLEHCLKEGHIRDIAWRDVEERFPEVKWYCNEHVFKLMQERQGVSDRDYWKFIRFFNGAPVKKAGSTSLELPELFALIKAAGGVAILAHPHAQTQYIPEMVKMGLGGVETDHPDMDEHDKAEARRIAQELGLYRSGGTDHTGLLGNNMSRGDIPGGSEITPYDADVENGADQDEFMELLSRSRG